MQTAGGILDTSGAESSAGFGLTSSRTSTVFVVDDDDHVRQSLELLMTTVNLPVKGFSSPFDFLQCYQPAEAGCLVLDVRMPGMSGIELFRQLKQKQMDVPTIMLTAHGEVPMVAQIMREGVFDFIVKPFSPNCLLERINQAIQVQQRNRAEWTQRAKVERLLEKLSSRERQVLDRLIGGYNSKQIANQLEITSKTVDNHRARVFEKMATDNVAKLTGMMIRYYG